jgi:hypothetical protein
MTTAPSRRGQARHHAITALQLQRSRCLLHRDGDSGTVHRFMQSTPISRAHHHRQTARASRRCRSRYTTRRDAPWCASAPSRIPETPASFGRISARPCKGIARKLQLQRRAKTGCKQPMQGRASQNYAQLSVAQRIATQMTTLKPHRIDL